MPNKQLSLSIVIPAYNEEFHLKRCLDAIAKQTTKPNEVIVVDNNSTDKTIQIAKKYKFVKVIKEPKQGVVFARNKGFNATKSDLIGRIDADTILPRNWCKTAKQLLNNPDFAAATGPVSYYDMPLNKLNYWIDHQIRKHLYKGAPHVPFLFGSNSVVRRSVWQKLEPKLCTKPNIHEDLDLAIHLTQAGFKILYEKRLLAGTSARRYDDKIKDFNKYMGMYIQTYKNHDIFSSVPHIATSFYWSGYIVFRFLRLSYDDKRAKRSLRTLFRPTKPRKNPMSH